MCACAQVCKQYVSLNRLDVGASPLGGRVIKHMQTLTVHYAVSVPLPPTPPTITQLHVDLPSSPPPCVRAKPPSLTPHTNICISVLAPHQKLLHTITLAPLCIPATRGTTLAGDLETVHASRHMGRRERGMRNTEGGSIRKNDSVPAMGQKRRLMEELAA